MNRPLDDAVVLITGAAAGIGQATALAFAERGARVALADVKADRGEALAHRIEEAGGRAMFVATDVSRLEQVDRLVRSTVDTFGRLDAAFNNAGIEGTMAPTVDCTDENFERTLAINLTGVWYCLRAELRQMTAQGDGGAVVNMASVAGLVGFPNLPAYVASKHAVVGLTRSAALEHATTGIRVNAVCPGVIHTEMIDRITGRDPAIEKQFVGLEPMGRMGTPREIADAVLWLCSPEASFVTGHALAVDGGFVAH